MILESQAFKDNEPLSLATLVTRVDLTGPVKDIKKAADARLARARELDRGKARMMLLAIRPHVTDHQLKGMGNMTDENLWRFAQAVGRQMLSHNTTKWWLDHQKLSAYHNLAEAARHCIRAFTKTQPFR